MDSLQEEHEIANGDAFFEWFNAKVGTSYSFSRRAGQAPDLVYSFGSRELFVEVTAAYCDDGPHAKFLGDGVYSSSDVIGPWVGVNSDKSLAQEISNRISHKSQNFD